MKNIKLFSLLFVAAAMIFAGCTKETESVEPGGGTEEGLVYKEFKVGASEADGSKSRTELGPADEQGNRSVLWQENDKIRVFADVDGANADGYEFTTKEGGESVTFGGMVAQADNYYALYPYDAYESSKGFIKEEDGSVYICANIPDVQKVPVEGGYDPKACLSVAQLNSDGTTTFKLACGIIGIQFENKTNSKIKEIKVSFKDYSRTNNEYLKINVDGNIEQTNISEDKNIRLLPDVDGGEFQDGKIYYVCLPPILKDGITITVSFVNSESISLVKTLKNVKLDRGQNREVSSLILTDADYHKIIDNKTDFINWYNNELNRYPEVTIKGHINMSGEEALEAQDFYGVLNGENCVIENLKMTPSSTRNNGLFASLNGAIISNITLTNLEVGASVNVGAICGSAVNSTIKGCQVNKATITGQIVGGVVGVFDHGIVDGCAITDIEIHTYSHAGGLVASYSALSGDSFFKASYVTGKIYDDLNMGMASIGGIIGWWKNSAAKIISCYSFMELPSDAGYVYSIPYTEETKEMYSSWYVNNSLKGDGVMTVQGLKDIMGSDDIDGTMNNYLKQANSEYRYVVNPNYSVEDFLTPPLILQKAQ